MPPETDVLRWQGLTVVGPDGGKIGRIEEIYLDVETERPEWALVNTGLFGTKASFVPIADAVVEDDQVKVPFEKSRVKDAPNMDPDGQLSQEEEAELYRHYGRRYGEARSGSGLPEGDREARGQGHDAPDAGRDISGPTTDDAMTRSEEELRVGTRQRESGRVRLRKYVVTEEVARKVPVQREEVRVEREPITDENAGQAMAGPEISDEEHETTLYEEEPVVEKRTVPRERVRMRKENASDEETVHEQVRKERIETDDPERR
jgi:uncharacterized protein (TIGR02271 family)